MLACDHDRGRAVGAIEWRQLADDGVDGVDGEVDDERRAAGGEGRKLFAFRHARGAAGDSIHDC